MQRTRIILFLVCCEVAFGQEPGVLFLPIPKLNGKALKDTEATVKDQVNYAMRLYNDADKKIKEIDGQKKQAEAEIPQLQGKVNSMKADIEKRNATINQHVEELMNARAEVEARMTAENDKIQSEIGALTGIKLNKESHIKQSAVEKQTLEMRLLEMNGELFNVRKQYEDRGMIMTNNRKLEEAIQKFDKELAQKQDMQTHLVADTKSIYEHIPQMREITNNMHGEILALQQKNKELTQTLTETTNKKQKIYDSLQKLRGGK